MLPIPVGVVPGAQLTLYYNIQSGSYTKFSTEIIDNTEQILPELHVCGYLMEK
jgi:hypothetical protein